MSHFSEVKTKIKNRETLKKALAKLGFEIVEAEAGSSVDVRGYFGESQAAEFKILTSTHYDIGFRLNEEGTYEIVGDWELLPKVSGIECEAFTKQVKREYAHQSVLAIAEKMGYGVEYANQGADENGEMQISVKQWG